MNFVGLQGTPSKPFEATMKEFHFWHGIILSSVDLNANNHN
jgi:hypothetical protein